MNKYALFVVLSTVFLFPASTFAGPIIRTGEVVSVGAEQLVKGDFYGFGSKVIVSGTAENDVYLGGATVTVNAPIQQDASIVGGAVQIHGEVADDVRVIGGDVVIGAPVKGDVVVFGGSLALLSTASVDGDVIFYGGELTIEGKVNGGVYGSTESVRIDAEVGGDIDITVASPLVLGSNAKTLGTVTYTSAHELVRAQDAVVTNDPHRTVPSVKESASPFYGLALEFLLIGFVTLLLFVVMRRPVSAVIATGVSRVGVAGLIGLGVILATPFVSVMLMLSFLGLLAGVLLLVTYVALILAALALAPLMLGFLCTKYLFKHETVTPLAVLCGVLAWSIMSVLSVFGMFIMVAFTIMTVGALSLTLYERLRA